MHIFYKFFHEKFYLHLTLLTDQVPLSDLEQRLWRHPGVFDVNFEHISHFALVYFVNFEHVITSWVTSQNIKQFVFLNSSLGKW